MIAFELIAAFSNAGLPNSFVVLNGPDTMKSIADGRSGSSSSSAGGGEDEGISQAGGRESQRVVFFLVFY